MAAYVIVMTGVAQHRVVGDYLKETDLYHLYAPDADRILQGAPPARTVNTGPVYPALLALAFAATGDHFASGKWLSLAASALAALTAFRLFRGFFGDRAALVALLFVLTGADFARFSVQATTDMPFLAAAVLAMVAVTRAAAGGSAWALAAGASSGLACLVRYNGLFLVGTALATLAARHGTAPRRWRFLGLYLVAFLGVLSPWLVVSYRLHGTPLFNRTHLMMAIVAYDLPRDLDGVHAAAARFGSIAEVVGHDPARFIGRYLGNLASTVANSLGAPLAILPLGLLALAGAGRVVRRPADSAARPLVLSLAVYLLVIALVHWESRYVLYVAVGYAGLAAHAVNGLTGWARQRWRPRAAGTRAVAALLVLIPLGPALVRTPRRVVEMLERQPVELLDAAAALRAEATGKRVMGRKPHLAYLVGGTWVYLPEVASLDALREMLCRTPAEYLVYDTAAQRFRPELERLSEPTRTAAPWLAPVYAHPTRPLFVYAVTLGEACTPFAHAAGP